jgi:hypothetical protein
MSVMPVITYRQRAIVSVFATGILIGVLAISGAMLLLRHVHEAQDNLAFARRAVETIAQRGDPVVAQKAARDALDARLVKGRTAAEAQASLQTLLKEIAQRRRMDIESLQPLPTENAGGLLVLRIKLSGSLPESELGPVITEFGAAPTPVFVDAIEIKPEIQRSTASSDKPEERRLSVRLDVGAHSRLGLEGEQAR